MNGMALLAGISGTAYGALIFWLMTRPRRIWAIIPATASWAVFFIVLVTVQDRARPWWHHTIVPLIWAMIGANIVSTAIISRTQRRTAG
jgi:hypothetical protein